MSKKTLSILIIILTTFLISIAQVLIKKGSLELSSNLLSILTNYFLISGLFIYVICLFLITYSLRNGEISVLYPIISLGYIWVAILSFFIFSEPLTTFKVAGIFVIVLGVSLIGIGGKK